MVDKVTVYVPGVIYWAKIIGAPRLNYEGDGKEWGYDLMPDDVTFLKDAKLLDRLKTDKKGVIPDDYIHLKKPELNKDGEKNEPIRIYDSEGGAWDGALLGNGTRVVAKLNIMDWGKGKKKSIYTQALRIEELVSYVSNEFGGYDAGGGATDTAPAKTAKATKKPVEELVELDEDEDAPF